MTEQSSAVGCWNPTSLSMHNKQNHHRNRWTYRVNAAVEHDGLAHVLEDDAATADLIAGPDGHDAHGLVVIFHAFPSGVQYR